MYNNVLARENTTTVVEPIIFDSVQGLYEDLLSNQSFIVSADIYCDDKPIIEGSTIYRHVELHNGHLLFHGNKFGGSELHISSDLISASKKGYSSYGLFEYKLTLEHLDESFVLIACKSNTR